MAFLGPGKFARQKRRLKHALKVVGDIPSMIIVHKFLQPEQVRYINLVSGQYWRDSGVGVEF
jgi:hypothetical protein